MNNDIYLNFLYKLIVSNQIIERTVISKFFENREIDEKNIIKKTINITKAIVKVKLENNKFLLIEDLPINFFLSHTIIVGDKSNLVEFTNEENEIIICKKEVYSKVKKIIKTKNLKNFESSKLHNLNYEFNFELAEIIKNIQVFSLEKNKINLKKIHLVNSNKVENFLPTIKQFHFKIAQKMHLPIMPIIENNFIKKSIINIKEINSIIEKIKPILTYENNQIWDFEKDTGNKIFKDIKKEVVIKIDKNMINSTINEVKKINIDKDILIGEIENKKEIVLSSTFSKVPIPLFKSYEEQKFIEIKDTKDFLDLTGVYFKLDEKILDRIFLQSLRGEKTLYKNYFLNKKIENILENLKEESKIKYKTIDELIIKLIFNNTSQTQGVNNGLEVSNFLNIDEIKKIENLNQNLIKELIKILKYLIKKTILLSIKNNKIPQKNLAESIIEKYYQSFANSLNIEFENYKNKPSKKELLNITIREINNVLSIIKNSNFEFEHLYFYNQISLILIRILFEFNEQNSIEIKNLFYGYFKEEKFEIKKSSINLNLENLVLNINFANRISKKYKAYIIKKSNFDSTLLSKKIKFLKSLPNKIIIKPNNKKLKNLFPYRFDEISKQIKDYKINSNIDEIKLKNNIKISKEFFSLYNSYKNYKVISDNQFFLLAIKNPESSLIKKHS